MPESEPAGLRSPVFYIQTLTWLSQVHEKSRQKSCISLMDKVVAKRKNAKKRAESLWPSPGSSLICKYVHRRKEHAGLVWGKHCWLLLVAAMPMRWLYDPPTWTNLCRTKKKKKKKSHQNSSIFGIVIAFFTLIFARVIIIVNICTRLFSFLSSGVLGVPNEVWDKAKEVWSEYSFHIKFPGLKGSRACLAPFVMNWGPEAQRSGETASTIQDLRLET